MKAAKCPTPRHTSRLTVGRDLHSPHLTSHREADNLTSVCDPNVYNARICGSLDVAHPYGTPRPATGIPELLAQDDNMISVN
jgi:hypothetical protein